MGKALTSAELEHFAQDGYLPARRLATRDQAADWRRQLEALEQYLTVRGKDLPNSPSRKAENRCFLTFGKSFIFSMKTF